MKRLAFAPGWTLSAACATVALVAGMTAFVPTTRASPAKVASPDMTRFKLDAYFRARSFVPDKIKNGHTPPPGYGVVHQRFVRQKESVEYEVTVAPSSGAAAHLSWKVEHGAEQPGEATTLRAPLKNGVRRVDQMHYSVGGPPEDETQLTALVGHVYISFLAISPRKRQSSTFPFVVRDVKRKLLTAARQASAS